MAAEAQLRAEVFQLRRSNTSLNRRVSQMQGLLGELEPLWLDSPNAVQEQVQLAITAHTPRVGVVSSTLDALKEEGQQEPAARALSPPVQKREELPATQSAASLPWPAVGVLPAAASRDTSINRTSPVTSDRQWQRPQPKQPMQTAVSPKPGGLSCTSPPSGTPAKPVPQLSLGFNNRLSQASAVSDAEAPNTHRMDDDDDDDLEHVGGTADVGQVTASPEHYKALLGSLKTEMAARQKLEQELKSLRQDDRTRLPERDTTDSAPDSVPLQPDAIARLNLALATEERSRRSLLETVHAASEEWEWYHLPTGKHATQAWGVLAPNGARWNAGL